MSCPSGSQKHEEEAQSGAVLFRVALSWWITALPSSQHCSPCSCSALAVGELLSLFLRDLGTCLQHHVDHTEPLVPAGAKRESGSICCLCDGNLPIPVICWAPPREFLRREQQYLNSAPRGCGKPASLLCKLL